MNNILGRQRENCIALQQNIIYDERQATIKTVCTGATLVYKKAKPLIHCHATVTSQGLGEVEQWNGEFLVFENTHLLL